MNEIYYPRFEGLIAERGVMKTVIAEEIGVSVKTFKKKLKGISAFTWDEVERIQNRFFPDITKDELMMRKNERVPA